MGSLPGSFPSVTMTTRSTTRDGAGFCQADGSTSSAAATTVHASACGLTPWSVSWTAGYTTRGASAVGANSMTNRCDAQQRLKTDARGWWAGPFHGRRDDTVATHLGRVGRTDLQPRATTHDRGSRPHLVRVATYLVWP